MLDPVPPHNRRFPRKPPKPAVRATLHTGGAGQSPDVAIALLDLSRSGACYATVDPLKSGQAVDVTLRGFAHPRPIPVPAEVVWCMPAPSGTYIVAVAFAQPLDPAEWAKLV